ncbi:MAG: sigma-70 family RNA polymerase sigma factor [Candidatus Promineifilaceae bacterium]|nr:sigma-70 family RNA polymerase sigma factor [Candidatus Promineifilaceae bacterium]
MSPSETLDKTALEEERKLLRDAKAGNQEAFGNIYDLYLERVYRFVLVRVSNQQTAEDLTSEIFLKAWDNLDGYEQRQFSFGAWLFRIARNTVIDHYRTRKEHLPLVEPERLPADQVLHADERAETRLAAAEVLEAMQELTAAQREVLHMKLVDNMSTNEVARLLGKKPGAIRALQMRGLRALSKVLGISNG